MKKLDFPIIASHNLKERHLSMDEYLDFVCFNLEHTFTETHKKKVKQLKKLWNVNIPFSFKG